MEPRTSESAMEWEYNDQGPMDPESPFATWTNQNRNAFAKNNSSAGLSIFGLTPGKNSGHTAPRMGSQQQNPFASKAAQGSDNASPLKRSSIFDRSFQNANQASRFLNPSFTTPRKPIDDSCWSEMSGADSSPAVTDADLSELPADSPDANPTGIGQGFESMGISPSREGRAFMYGKSPALPARISGRGEIPRGKYSHLDKIRKRKRHNEDRDVGAVRHRGRADSSSEWNSADDTDVVSRAPRGAKSASRRSGGESTRGWVGSFLSAVSNNPNAPEVLEKWLQFILRAVIMSIVIYFLWVIVLSIKRDMFVATDKARSERLGNITQCATNYRDNQCYPREKRLPKLIKDCDDWEVCMNQDPDEVQTVTLGVKQFAELLNELVSTMHYKTIGFIGGITFLAILATRGGGAGGSSLGGRGQAGDERTNFGVGKIGGLPSFGHPAPDPNQAYIWAPIRTPHRLGHTRAHGEGTDTETTPDMYRSIIAPPETPSRRSPGKEKRLGSPSKGTMSPQKGYF